MAVAAYMIKITREDVYQWLLAFSAETHHPKPLREFLVKKIQDLHLPDLEVDISARDDIEGPTINVIELILLDLHSYGYPFK